MFNANVAKEAQEIIFSQRRVNPFHPQVPVECSVSHKHLGLHLDQKLDFNKFMKKSLKNKIEYQLLKNLYSNLPRNASKNI